MVFQSFVSWRELGQKLKFFGDAERVRLFWDDGVQPLADELQAYDTDLIEEFLSGIKE